jgi:heme-degrading monooxygenase HmoA
MLLQVITVQTRDAVTADVETALCEVRQRVFMSAGFRGLKVFQSIEDPSTYQVHVLWQTHEELLDHVESGRFELCWRPVRTHVIGPPHLEHLTERENLTLHEGVLTASSLDWLREHAD